MVIRGYPEEVRRAPSIVSPPPPPIKPAIEPSPDVKYVYYIPEYPPTERIQLDPNIAIIALGIVAVVGTIVIMFSRPRK